MSSVNTEVSLRVLYTVNTSPQYILAKAPHKIAFVPADNASPSASPPKHGRASVKACAMAICRSSPELRPDATKDFSVYILDPLEDLISKSRHGQSGGVAVGMGLLSGMLSPYTPDTAMVTGTFVGCGQSEEALEVVISLRQVAPSVIRSVDDRSHLASGLTRTKSIPKCFNNDQPYLTSSPLPLPSLDERLFASYAQPIQYESQAARPKEPRKHNPAHSTRAHQLPTPYIGPPKRKYMRESERSKEQLAESSCRKDCISVLSNGQSRATSEKPIDGANLEPPSSQTSMYSDIGSPAPSLQPFSVNETLDLSEAAVMLTALSSVSSKASDGKGTLPTQGTGAPNPDLVSFLRAYLAALESQHQGPTASSDGPGHVCSTSQNPVLSFQPCTSDQADGSVSMVQTSVEDRTADKENQKPPPTTQESKNKKPKGSGSTSPLGSGQFNSRMSDSRPSTASTAEQSNSNVIMTTVSQSNDCSRKRKLSDASSSEHSSLVRRRSSSTPKGKLSMENLSGIRVNTGWGGLRVRSDGSLWGEHPPQMPLHATSSVSTTRPNEQPFLFRSSGKIVSTAPVRKGPYVVPDWAKGVPPPSPPPRPESSNEAKDGKKARKQAKSKGLGRLGGKGSIKRMGSTNMEPEAPTTPPRCSQNVSSTLGNSPATPKQTPGKLPIFAYSSPAGKSTLATLFQAFQTSPCRPAPVRKTLHSTPAKQSTISPGGPSRYSSLFTPSPVTAKPGSGTKPRTLFEGEDPPPSPTPTKKRSVTSEVLTNQQFSSASTSPEHASISREDHSDPPSSLPIASSDDLLDDSNSIQAPSMPSDSIIVNLSKIHDWSSLGLPPSSPPPPSSPSAVPMEGSDLPCSDIPSDLSEVESPPVFDIDNSEHAFPAVSQGQENRTETIIGNLGFNSALVSSNESTPESFASDAFPPSYMTGGEGPSAIAVFEALNNGLGQENYSEVWNLLKSICDQIPPAANLNGNGPLVAQSQSWITENLDSTPGFDISCSLALDRGNEAQGPTPEAQATQDTANIMATNFEDLLKGCLV